MKVRGMHLIDSSAAAPVAQHNNRIALVLQGGGALGAINAAIIAGNEPE